MVVCFGVGNGAKAKGTGSCWIESVDLRWVGEIWTWKLSGADRRKALIFLLCFSCFTFGRISGGRQD